jgi:hypothetical protein
MIAGEDEAGTRAGRAAESGRARCLKGLRFERHAGVVVAAKCYAPRRAAFRGFEVSHNNCAILTDRFQPNVI